MTVTLYTTLTPRSNGLKRQEPAIPSAAMISVTLASVALTVNIHTVNIHESKWLPARVRSGRRDVWNHNHIYTVDFVS